MGTAKFRIIDDRPGMPLVIRDVGPWDRFMSVTNAAEEVVRELHECGKLDDDRRLFYYDSEGEFAELVHSGAAFLRFAAAERR